MRRIRRHEYEKVNACLTSWFDRWQNGKFSYIWQYWGKKHIPTGTLLHINRIDGNVVSGILNKPLITGDIVMTVNGEQITLRVDQLFH